MLKELEKPFEDLLEILREELFKHQLLLDLLLLQRKCIMDRDVETFEKVIESQQEIISDIIYLENKRDVIIRPFAIALNKQPREVVVSDIYFILSEDKKSILEDIIKELNSAMKEIERIRQGNEYLIKHSLLFIQKVLDFAFENPSTYQINGNVGANQYSKSVFISKSL